MPRWLIEIYISIGASLALAAVVGVVGIMWWKISNGAWWGLVAYGVTLIVCMAGIPTLVWLVRGH